MEDQRHTLFLVLSSDDQPDMRAGTPLHTDIIRWNTCITGWVYALLTLSYDGTDV